MPETTAPTPQERLSKLCTEVGELQYRIELFQQAIKERCMKINELERVMNAPAPQSQATTPAEAPSDVSTTNQAS